MWNVEIKRRELKGTCLHDFPYPKAKRKCPHSVLISATESGCCVFRCPMCYARAYPWSKEKEITVYSNLVAKLRKELEKAYRIFPIYLSQVTDPLQPIKEVRELSLTIISLLVEWNLSFGVVTKSAFGPLWLLREIKELKEYPYWFLALTIEATERKRVITSPFASKISDRFRTVSYFNKIGIPAVVRLDPTLLGVVDEADVILLISRAQESGSRHIIGSTGYFNKVSITRVGRAIANSEYSSRLKDFFRLYRFSPEKFAEYEDRRRFTVPLSVRIRFHTWLRKEVESRGMTYAVCQELPREYDSSNIPSCEGVGNIAVSVKGSNGRFKPIPCQGDCLRFCPDRSNPPCGYPNFMEEYPFKYKSLFSPATPRLFKP